jgi:hypothetical protein
MWLNRLPLGLLLAGFVFSRRWSRALVELAEQFEKLAQLTADPGKVFQVKFEWAMQNAVCRDELRLILDCFCVP